MCKAATRVRIGVVLALVALGHPRSSAQAQDGNAKIGPQLRRAAASSNGRSRVIVRASDAASTGPVRSMIANGGGGLRRHLASINADFERATPRTMRNTPSVPGATSWPATRASRAAASAAGPTSTWPSRVARAAWASRTKASTRASRAAASSQSQGGLPMVA